ncbi:MAG: Fic family protein [Candidatus Omnitrophica bacterium]|nr:Fic family protein [Candidatus Omnitrophota bacterium]
MNKTGRYDTSGSLENQFEPGSGGRVLRNLLGIKNKKRIDRLEAGNYAATFEKAIKFYGKSHRFSTKDIRHLHKIWLGDIYAWAGCYRTVNLSKRNFSFATARYVPSLMEEFEKKTLAQHTPCKNKKMPNVIKSLAVVHVELILIHPFREGNGRLARMLSVLMALQAGLPGLDFSGIRGGKKAAYFAAVRAGLDKDYAAMTAIFRDIVKRTIQRVSG